MAELGYPTMAGSGEATGALREVHYPMTTTSLDAVGSERTSARAVSPRQQAALLGSLAERVGLLQGSPR